MNQCLACGYTQHASYGHTTETVEDHMAHAGYDGCPCPYCTAHEPYRRHDPEHPS